MKLIARSLMSGIALLVVAVPAAHAKEEVTASVCGSARCVTVAGLEARIADSYAWTAAPKPAAFYSVRMVAPLLIPGLRAPIVYVPARGVWRLTMANARVWVHVPSANARALRWAVRALAPCAPSKTWTCRR